MKLHAVFYELYESDLLGLSGHENGDEHEIDREVRLETDQGVIHVSWMDQPSQFCIGYKSTRWNTNDPEIVLDASGWSMWTPLIGQRFELIYTDKSHEVLELKSSAGNLFFSAQRNGVLGSDVCHISRQNPAVRT